MPSFQSKEFQHNNSAASKNMKTENMNEIEKSDNFDNNNNNNSGSGGAAMNSSNGNLSNNNNNLTENDETSRCPNNQLQQQQQQSIDMEPVNPSSVGECLGLFKACCKKKADFGLEDLFWILFLLIVIIFLILKGLTRYTWSQLAYSMFGSIGALILIYVGATIYNKFVLEDSSTAHWNAHARYTQAAIRSRINDEEQRVHVIAPPKMGGAKLNIIYTVGDGTLAKTASSGSTSTLNGQPSSRQGSISSGGVGSHALTNLTQQAINTAAALLGSTPATTSASTTNSFNNTTTIKCSSSANNPPVILHHHHHSPSSSTSSSSIPSKSPITLTNTSGSGNLLDPSVTTPLLSTSLTQETIAEEEDRPETPSK